MNHSLILDRLSSIELFQFLDAGALDDLSRTSQVRHIAKGDRVFSVGDDIRFVYVVMSGSIKMGIKSTNNNFLIKGIVYEGEILGENVFTTESKRKKFALAQEKSTVLEIRVNKFHELVIANDIFAESVMRLIIERLQIIQNRIRSFVFDKAKERIVGFLKSTAAHRGIKIGIDEFLINHGLSHQEIALMTDTSRQTVARVLGELKKDNLIHFSTRKPGKILLRSGLGLA